MLAIKLPEEAEVRLAAAAEANGQTMVSYAMDAILTYLEDCEDAAMAKEAYLEFKASGAKGIPLAEIERRFGLGS
jgi:predicted DNA-binding protein